MSAGTEPILTAHLFPKLEKMLIQVLSTLGADDWEKETIAPKWKVKDVAAHLLDTELRRLSVCRDGYRGEAPAIGSHADLVAFVNRMNQEGVSIFRRLSPDILISLIEQASSELCDYFASLDPFAPAQWGVSWAGEERSANWFDIAREFTERWHHQQQIRLAVDKPGIMTRELYYPVLDCFMRALPFHYRTIMRKPSVAARFRISGECGGDWYLFRGNESWEFRNAPTQDPVSEAIIPQEIAWRIFTKGIDRDSAKSQIKVSGDIELGTHILGMISIIG
ncbi:MAG TPA: maleylpyruvate isomerase family mycothiol-dependent enzyme [Candidatus Angelobacter sp.]